MTQGIMTAGSAYFAKSAGFARSSMAKTANGPSFNSLMEKRTSESAISKDMQKEPATAADKLRKPDTDVVKPPAANQSEQPDTISKDEVSASKEGLLSDSQEVQDKAEELIHEIKDVIKKLLNITDEELTDLMSQLGITAGDLIDPKALLQLTLKNAGQEDSTALLTNEKLSDVYSNLKSMVDNLINQSGLTKDEAASAIDRMQKLQMPEQEVFHAMVEQPVKKETNSSEQIQNTTDHNAASDSGKKEIGMEVIKDSYHKGNSDKKEMQNNTQANGVEQFIKNVTDSVNTDQTGMNGKVEKAAEMRDIANQLLDHIKITMKEGQTSMQLQLNPEHLGKVNLEVISKDGIMTAQFTTQNQIAKEAIESQIQIFKDNLVNQGLKVDAIEVSVAASFNFNFSQSNQTASGNSSQGGQAKRRNINLNLGEELIDQSEAENIVLDMMERSGNTVDYSA